MKIMRGVRNFRATSLIAAVAVGFVAGCDASDGERFGALLRENNALKADKIQLEERLAKRDAEIESLGQQFRRMREQGKIPPAPVFVVDRVEILGLTGGSDLDGKLGDDHVTVYFRPIDQDGDTLKRAGEIVIKLLDVSTSLEPRVLGLRADNSPERIRALWYGRFWTDYFKVDVPVYKPSELRPGQEIDVHLTFMEFATGKTFTDRRAVRVNQVVPDGSNVQ